MGGRGAKGLNDRVYSITKKDGTIVETSRIHVPDWLTKKNHMYDYKITDMQIKAETEKAYLVNTHGFDRRIMDEGYFDVWLPKSQLMTDSELKAEIKKSDERYEKYLKNGEIGLARNQALRQLAIDNNVKGIRKRNTTATLEKLLKKAGINYEHIK
ncbi:hypothetical protein [Fastidiosipila sanguinis]|uniref:Uncharacterized protein n=1 Tax=Fastidiosipila sanguinis TaxID=236753 RepID=A0A2S0KP83_9FIRM|nr:hypothetical protein [Fastidiosipila sanguinis]AVM42833.1 hypothetical protein C5Q98_06240 [Fastidiosipila sanguinis]